MHTYVPLPRLHIKSFLLGMMTVSKNIILILQLTQIVVYVNLCRY